MSLLHKLTFKYFVLSIILNGFQECLKCILGNWRIHCCEFQTQDAKNNLESTQQKDIFFSPHINKMNSLPYSDVRGKGS